MPEQLPIWRNEGIEPPESLKTSGWEPGMKPSAQHMNWLFNQLAVLAANAGTTVEDLLTSTSIANALSANQGRVLNNNLTTLGNQVTQHLDEIMPHKFVDGGKIYRWGFRTVNGEPQMIYEEVTT